jgi:hypothetical protein
MGDLEMSERTYAGKVEDGIVTQAIVGTAQWAETNLGGEWHDSSSKIGIGWLWDGTSFTPPPAPEPEGEPVVDA